MEHPLAEFDSGIPGKFLVLLIDCNGDRLLLTSKNYVPHLGNFAVKISPLAQAEASPVFLPIPIPSNLS